MTRKGLFNSRIPRATAVNQAGGLAYRLGPKHALAQLAATGCLSNTYYATGEAQIETVIALVEQVDDNVFLAKLALYSRQRAMMKDMPAALLLALSTRDSKLFRQTFPRIVDNGRVLRTLFQFLRAGTFGRRSLSYSLQRAFQRWLNEANVGALLSASIGHDPSLRDIMRMARPTPPDNARRALFGWLTDRPVAKWAPATESDLPAEVRDLTAFRRAETEEQQLEILERNRFRWDLLADSARGKAVWKAIARQMGPQALRMNLNTLQRHGVLEDQAMVAYVAGRLGDAEEVRRGRQFPYQYFAAFLNAESQIPAAIRQGLESAAELACGNVPELPGPVLIGVDVSGSMSSPVTGVSGRGTPSKVRCVDVAGLFAAAILRRNPTSILVPFDTQAHQVTVAANEGILPLARRLAAYGGGGTDCSIPLSTANTTYHNRQLAGVVLISDNESWVGTGRYGSTRVMEEWSRFVGNQGRLSTPWSPRLVCIDLQSYTTTQAQESADILNVGGFSDSVFEVINGFMRDDGSTFVNEVEAMEL